MKVHATSKISAWAAAAALTVAFAQPSHAQATAQDSSSYKQPAEQVTVFGCVVPETDFRKAHDSGRGGFVGTGAGLGNEYVLVRAFKVSPGAPMPGAQDCSSAASAAASASNAYELTGSHEGDVKPFVGKWVEISGKMKAAEVTTRPSGNDQPQPTGGFDPMKQDLKLFEINVESVREAPTAAAVVTPTNVTPVAETTPPPAATSTTPAPAPQAVAATSGREVLPRTASPLPLIGLLGMLFLAAAAAIRALTLRS